MLLGLFESFQVIGLKLHDIKHNSGSSCVKWCDWNSLLFTCEYTIRSFNWQCWKRKAFCGKFYGMLSVSQCPLLQRSKKRQEKKDSNPYVCTESARNYIRSRPLGVQKASDVVRLLSFNILHASKSDEYR